MIKMIWRVYFLIIVPQLIILIMVRILINCLNFDLNDWVMDYDELRFIIIVYSLIILIIVRKLINSPNYD